MRVNAILELLQQRQVRLAMAILSGILNGIAFIWIGGFSLFANVPLLLALSTSPRLTESVFLGAIVGFLAGLHIYGIAHYGWFLLICFSFYTASQMMLYGGLFHVLWPYLGRFARLWLPVCLWVLTEWLRTIGSYSMPASYVGNIALDTWLSPWLYLAPIMGGLFVSGCVALVQAAIFLTTLNYTHYKRTIWCAALMLIVLGLSGMNAEPPLGDRSVKVIGVQAGLHNSRYDAAKVDPLSRAEVVSTFEHLSQIAYASKPDLVIWPETAIRDDVLGRPKLRARLFPDKNSSTTLIAGLHRRRADKLYNAAIAIENGQETSEVYKRKLVMGTEGHFTAGENHHPLKTRVGLIGAMICLEAVYGKISQTLVAQGAELLVVMSNDAGFGYSPITHHMTRRAAVRALETGRWLVRVGQAGLSVILSPRGEIVEKLALFEPRILSGNVGLRADQTLYVRYPWLYAAFNHFGLLCLGVLAARNRRTRMNSPSM